jgi:hypothetical protein
VAAIVAPLDERLIDRRDRAILCSGSPACCGAPSCLRSTSTTSSTLKVSPGRFKTDQEGEGYTVGITYGIQPTEVPGARLGAWLAAAELAGRDHGFIPTSDHGNSAPR